MKANIDQITESGEFTHLETLPWTDIIPFIIRYLKNYSLMLVLYLLLLLSSIVFLIIIRLNLSDYSFISVFPVTLSGLIVAPLLLVIPHELIHIAVYYLAGARSIKAGRGEGMAYIWVAADKFPMRSAGYAIVAAAPLVIITVLLLLTNSLLPPLWQWFSILGMVSHIIMSCGDIAIINFLWLNRRRGMITWDDTDRREAVFYVRSGQ